MARKALTFDEKVANAVEKDLTSTQEDFCDWLETTTGVVIDRDTLKLTQRLYQEYINDEAVQARIAERKEANKAKAVERDKNRLTRLLKQAKALGAEITLPEGMEIDLDDDDADDDEA